MPGDRQPTTGLPVSSRNPVVVKNADGWAPGIGEQLRRKRCQGFLGMVLGPRKQERSKNVTKSKTEGVASYGNKETKHSHYLGWRRRHVEYPRLSRQFVLYGLRQTTRSHSGEDYNARQPQFRIPRRTVKGGSHLCAPNNCFRYRPAARQPPMIDTGMKPA